jgi:hypothetical protein
MLQLAVFCDLERHIRSDREIAANSVLARQMAAPTSMPKKKVPATSALAPTMSQISILYTIIASLPSFVLREI